MKSAEEMAIMRTCGQIAAEILDGVCRAVAPGVMTKELDELAEVLIRRRGAQPAFLGYRGYPAHLCISVNEQVVHGIPGSRRLAAGDIVSVDLGVVYKGFVGDTACTIPVGRISEEAGNLIRVTEEALETGVLQAQPGNRLGDISRAIQDCVERHGYGVVRDFVGHGIGRQMHEEPQVPNYGVGGTGPRLVEGMVLCLEPMVTTGDWRVMVLDDHWTVVTRDGKLAAHVEHMVAITRHGPEVLTRGAPRPVAGRRS